MPIQQHSVNLKRNMEGIEQEMNGWEREREGWLVVSKDGNLGGSEEKAL